jgi:hypothetical protein
MSREYIREAYKQGIPLKEIAATLNTTVSAIKSKASRDPECPTHGSLSIKGVKSQNGIIGLEAHLQESKMRDATKAEAARMDRLLDQNGYDPERHRWQFGYIHLYNEEGKKEATPMVRNPQAFEETKANQEEFLKRLQKAAPRIRKSPVPTKTLAIPANFDVHIGKHCELIRTGNDYTPDKAVKQVLEGQAALFALTKPFGVTDILLPMGNDVVHVDNNNYTSTSGTPQDAYGSVESMMMLASEMYIRSIEGFAKNHNVWLTHVHSNHDRVAGWSVSQNVATYFRNHPRVHVHPSSIDQRPFKYFLFGNDLIVFAHMEGKVEEILGTIQEEISLVGKPISRIYVYIAHKHHKDVSMRGSKVIKNKEKDFNGLTTIKHGAPVTGRVHVEMVRSPSPADPWHALKGFHNTPAVEMFLHNEHSQFARFTHYF